MSLRYSVTDTRVLYKLFAGISDEELQKVLLTMAKLTLAEAKKMYSQEEMASDSHSTIRLTVKKQQNVLHSMRLVKASQR